ncbi:MAG: guanylate kinase [Acidobacteriota bacterium]
MSSKEPSPLGGIFVLSAPSGAGKTTLNRRLFERYPRVAERLGFSVSHTSRPMRPGEVQGKDYHFVSAADFDAMVAEDRFLEWAMVHGDRKGTSLDEVARLRADDLDVLLEIDVQGARQVRRRVPEAISIFILPPSYGDLELRLRGRGSENQAQMDRRLADAVTEIRGCVDYDYVIVNDDLDRACEALAAVFLTARHRRDRMRGQIMEVLATLPSSSQAPESEAPA